MTVIFPAETWAVYAKKIMAELHAEGVSFLKDEMKRLLEKIVEFTPPDTGTQGAVAVRKDISKIVTPIYNDTFREPRLAAIVEKKDTAAFAAFCAHVPSMAGGVIVSADQVPALHASQRNPRGRVGTTRLRNFVLGTDEAKKLRAYVARKVSNVGTALAGWGPALRFLGGSMNKPVTMLDVVEHGSYVANLENTDKPSVDAINSTVWANRNAEGQRIINNARQSRIQAMMSRLKYIVEGAAKNSGNKAA